MLNILVPNLKLIGILLMVYLGSLGVNTVLGIYYNIDIVKEQFSWTKLWQGLVRGGIILLAGAIITVIISLVPELLSSFGITAANDLFEGLSIGAIATVILSSIAHYLTDAATKLYKILRGNEEETEEK